MLARVLGEAMVCAAALPKTFPASRAFTPFNLGRRSSVPSYAASESKCPALRHQRTQRDCDRVAFRAYEAGAGHRAIDMPRFRSRRPEHTCICPADSIPGSPSLATGRPVAERGSQIRSRQPVTRPPSRPVVAALAPPGEAAGEPRWATPDSHWHEESQKLPHDIMREPL